MYEPPPAPPTETFSTQAEMVARAQALKSEGRVVHEIEDSKRGLLGFYTYLPRPSPSLPPYKNPENWSDDPILLQWPQYGQVLEPVETVVNESSVLQGAYNTHVTHAGFKPFTDPVRRTAGLVCHCMANTGKSLIFSVSLQTLKTLPKELLETIIPEVIWEK